MGSARNRTWATYSQRRHSTTILLSLVYDSFPKALFISNIYSDWIWCNHCYVKSEKPCSSLVSFTQSLTLLSSAAQWSRGMIPALGAGGPGFKSRLSPFLFPFLDLMKARVLLISRWPFYVSSFFIMVLFRFISINLMKVTNSFLHVWKQNRCRCRLSRFYLSLHCETVAPSIIMKRNEHISIHATSLHSLLSWIIQHKKYGANLIEIECYIESSTFLIPFN